MKNKLLILTAFIGSLMLASCSLSNNNSNNSDTTIKDDDTSKDDSSSEDEDTSDTDEKEDSNTEVTYDSSTYEVKDTSGNTISSGSAKVSFTYGRETTTKTINAKYLIDGVEVTISKGTYESASSSSDQVVFLVINGGSLTIQGSSSSYVNIVKSGSAASSGQVSDDYNFYGINSSIVVAGSSSSATISYLNMSSSSNGSNAIVATDSASVTISNSVITTSGNAGSRGLHATYNGNIEANKVKITTSGASCASIATDRGGGSITASNMELYTNGKGSPLIYSTGSITVKSSSGLASTSQMVVVEGGSSAFIYSSSFSCKGDGNRTGTSESDSSSHTIDKGGIFIYQSMSGDSEEGTDYFKAYDSSFTLLNSDTPMFYVTNITAEITLSNNTFTLADTSDYFLKLEETSAWGNKGSNGGKVKLSLTNQDISSYKAFIGTSSSSLNVSATDNSNTGISKETGSW